MMEQNLPLGSMTSWQVGGPAEYYVCPTTIPELQQILADVKSRSLPVTYLSGGTNVLIHDDGIKGVVIHMKGLKKITTKETNGQLMIEAECGAAKSELLKIFLKAKLAPALFLAGLPGDVGGGIVMNAGVSEALVPREFVEITDWVEVLRPDGTLQKLSNRELKWSYRHCEGWQPGVIIRAGISWAMDPEDHLLARVKEANRNRLYKQPLDLPSCGSVFVNPPGHKAGQLIEACGLKGFQIGNAQVSEKHANFIVNIGKCTAVDIHKVIAHVQETVLREKGIQLKTEVVYLGKW
jgi:UDP-N-acetylmuramate dehydrogenase